jgi:hypothetical protein
MRRALLHLVLLWAWVQELVAMPYTCEGKNTQQAAILKKENPTISAEYVSIGTQTEIVPSSEAAASQRVIKVAAAPATGTLVCLTEINGKTTLAEAVGSLVIGRVYYVRKVSTTEIELANTKAQSESATAGEHIELTVAIKTTTKIIEIFEATVTARIATGFGTIANGQGEDATAREVESNAANQKIKWIMYFSASTAGTCVGVAEVTERELQKGDIFKVTKTIGEENAGV